MATAYLASSQATLEWRGDCRACAGGWGLVEVALDAVQAEVPGTLGVGRSVPGDLCQRMMMTLLTYSYAAGIYASQDVELSCHSSPQVRYICARQYPSSETIQRFRRANRPLLKRCLTRVLTEAHKGKIPKAELRLESSPELEAPPHAQVQEFAEYKLRLATLLDMDADD